MTILAAPHGAAFSFNNSEYPSNLLGAAVLCVPKTHRDHRRRHLGDSVTQSIRIRFPRGVFRSVQQLKNAITASSPKPTPTQSPLFGPKSRQDHRRRQTRAASVRFDPLASVG